MRIRAHKSRRRAERITLNLASMIDVTFLLLIYFLLTTVLVPPEDRLAPLLQVQREDAAGEQTDFEPQIIDVVVAEGAPAYRIGTQLIHEREALTELLDGLPREAGVFVRVHDGAPVGFAVSAIQIARDVGFEQVTYVPAD